MQRKGRSPHGAPPLFPAPPRMLCNRHDGAESVLRRSKSLVNGHLTEHAVPAAFINAEAAMKAEKGQGCVFKGVE